MTAKEKKYFEFCGTRTYFATLAITLLMGIVCLSMSLPFIISANIVEANPEAINQQNISEAYKRYSQKEEGISKAYTELNIMTRLLFGVIAVSFVASALVTDTIRCRKIRKRLRNAREAKRASRMAEETKETEETA